MRVVLGHTALLLLAPPFFLGVINRTKAWFAGRLGPPLFQPYFDVIRLLRKAAVYSTTTTWLFRAGPMISLAAVFCAGLLLPLSGGVAPLSFSGDVILFAYLLGLGRFFTMAAALDTGSSFEGMGASREAAFAAFAEPALFFALAILCIPAHSAGIAESFAALPWATWGLAHPTFLAAAVALFAVILAENSRIPVDDPNTHLELTMIHEVMVLDHSGPDLAFILYGGALKLFVMGALLVHLLLPIPAQGGFLALVMFLAGELGVAIVVGIVESTMARLRLVRVPEFLIGAAVLAGIGLAALLYRGNP